MRKPFDLSGFVIRRALLIASGSLAVFCLLFPIMLFMVKPQYQAEGTFFIDPSRQYTLSGAERDNVPGTAGDYVRTLAVRVKDWDVLDSAISQLPPEYYPSFLPVNASRKSQMQSLSRHVTAVEMPRSYLMSIRLVGSKPDGLVQTLDVLMQAFIDKLYREKEQQVLLRQSYLRDERDAGIARLAEKQRLIDGGGDSLKRRLYLQEGYTGHIARLEWTQRLYVQTYSNQAHEQGLVHSAEIQAAEFRKLSLQPLADEKVSGNIAVTRLEQWTIEQVEQLKRGLDGLAAENPNRKAAEERIGSMTAFLNSYRSTVGTDALKTLVASRNYELQSEVIRARSTLSAYDIELQKMAALQDSAENQAAVISAAIAHSREDIFSLNQLRDRVVALDSRLDDLAMEWKSPVPVSITRHPLRPERPAKGKGDSVLPMALTVSLLLVLILVFLFDFFDDRIRSRVEIDGAIGGSSLDPVPLIAGDHVGDLDLADMSIPAVVAIRALAARLLSDREKHGARVFVFGGAGHGAGCTTLSWLVARALAAHGFRAGVIELCVERPGLWALAAQADPANVLDYLSENRPRLPIIGHGGIAVLAVPPDRIHSPTDMTPFGAMLTEAREQYDICIVDAGDYVTDDRAQFALVYADAALAVVREDVSTYHDLRIFLDHAERTAVTAVSSVLTMAVTAEPSMYARLFTHLWTSVTRLHRLLFGRVLSLVASIRTVRGRGREVS